MNTHLLLLLFVISLFIGGITHPQSYTVETAPVLTETVQYKTARGVDANLLSLDIYYQANTTDRPVLVYVHGGGWQTGDKANVAFKDDYFVQAGYVFVSTNYRLTPNVRFPTHARDVASAIRWVHDSIDNYGGDPTRIIVMGHSAGAHLATIVATDARYLNREGLSRADLTAVISLDTQAYDIEELDARRQGGLPPVYTNTFGTNPNDWRAASPITYVALGEPIPPMFVAYSRGTNPFRVNRLRAELSERFTNKLVDSAISTQLVGSTSQTHREINQEFGTPNDAVTEAAMAFINPLVTSEQIDLR